MKNLKIFIVCICMGIFFVACSSGNDNGNEANFLLLSTVPAENEIISPTTASVTFTFDKEIYIADKAKITLNGTPVSDAGVENKTSLRVSAGSLKGDTEYTLIVDKGAIKDGSNNLNKEAFSLKFKTTKPEDLSLVSTNPPENAVVPVSTDSVVFVFNKVVYIVDKTKITLNGSAVPDAWVSGTSLKIKTGPLVGDTEYTLIVAGGAIKDALNNNKDAFTLHFKTEKVSTIEGTVTQHGFLAVNGTALVDQQGKAVALHGVSLGWHNWWPRFYNEKTVTWLREDWKCAVVRAAIGVEPDGAYLSKPQTAFDCLYAVIDAAIKNDIYVIVDWHAGDVHLNEAKTFFQTVAQKYKDRPNLIYELYNEPDYETWSDVKAYSEELIKAIREIAPKNIILVGSPQWDQAIDKPAADPIKGYNNLMYTVHFYAATHGQWLRDAATAALKKGLPIFVSECGGMEASGDGAINKTEWQKWLDWMSGNSVSWAAWSVSDKNETCSMIKNTSSPVSGWTDSDLKEWGQIVRTELRK